MEESVEEHCRCVGDLGEADPGWARVARMLGLCTGVEAADGCWALITVAATLELKRVWKKGWTREPVGDSDGSRTAGAWTSELRTSRIAGTQFPEAGITGERRSCGRSFTGSGRIRTELITGVDDLEGTR